MQAKMPKMLQVSRLPLQFRCSTQKSFQSHAPQRYPGNIAASARIFPYRIPRVSSPSESQGTGKKADLSPQKFPLFQYFSVSSLFIPLIFSSCHNLDVKKFIYIVSLDFQLIENKIFYKHILGMPDNLTRSAILGNLSFINDENAV